jgi:hypothetical protein
MKTCLSVLLVLCLSSKVFAWGNEGHAIVAQIGEDHLLPNARAAILKLLPNTKLASVASWADAIKQDQQWVHTKPWHFVNIPDGEDYTQAARDPEGNVVTAISDMVKVLKNPSSSTADKQNALKFLVHLVGDIHQPLHAGRTTDRGGNDIKVMFQGRETNLHAIWDSGIIDTAKMDFATYARTLQTQKLGYDIPEFSFSQVLTEDIALRKALYNFKTNSNGEVQLDQAYVSANLAALNSRLLVGGMRLAQLLNTVFK